MRRTQLRLLYTLYPLLAMSISACSMIPDVCSTGVPTVKNCFTTSGNKGSYSIGPFNVINQKF